MGSAGLLQEFHHGLGPEDIELLAGGILEAAARLNRLAGTLPADEAERPVPLRAGKSAGTRSPATYTDVRSAAKETAFRDGRRPDLQLDLEDTPVTVLPRLMRRMVAELVHDAVRLSDRGTAVRVTLRAEGTGCWLEVATGGSHAVVGRARRRLAAARRIAQATGGVLEVDDRASTTTVRVRWRGVGRHVIRIRIPYNNPA
jgi:hypothetical protein